MYIYMYIYIYILNSGDCKKNHHCNPKSVSTNCAGGVPMPAENSPVESRFGAQTARNWTELSLEASMRQRMCHRSEQLLVTGWVFC